MSSYFFGVYCQGNSNEAEMDSSRASTMRDMVFVCTTKPTTTKETETNLKWPHLASHPCIVFFFVCSAKPTTTKGTATKLRLTPLASQLCTTWCSCVLPSQPKNQGNSNKPEMVASRESSMCHFCFRVYPKSQAKHTRRKPEQS